MAARNWTTEQRQQQAEKIRQHKPWELSTGAKTRKGKQKVARNGRKNAYRHLLAKDPLKAWLREVSPELAGDKQLMRATFGPDAEQEAATAEARRVGEEQIVRALTRAGVAIQQARQIARQSTQYEIAKEVIPSTIKQLFVAQDDIMAACQGLMDLLKAI